MSTANVVTAISLQWGVTPGKIKLIDVSRQLVDGNKRFSGICVNTEG